MSDRRPENPAEYGTGGCMWRVLLPSKNLLPFLRMDLYLRLTGLIAAGVALFLAPGDVGHLISQFLIKPSSHTDNAHTSIPGHQLNIYIYNPSR